MTDRRIDYFLIGFLALALLATPWVKRGRPDRTISNDSAEAVRRALISIQKDQGGRVSRRTLIDAINSEFDRLDRDRDGLLDPAELRIALLPVSPRTKKKSVF